MDYNWSLTGCFLDLSRILIASSLGLELAVMDFLKYFFFYLTAKARNHLPGRYLCALCKSSNSKNFIFTFLIPLFLNISFLLISDGSEEGGLLLNAM